MLNLITAMPSEARALIDAFRLRSMADAQGFRLYANDDVSLVVSGMGQVRAAAAVGWLAGRQRDTSVAAWLNVGIAGHGSRNVGDAFVAGRIRKGPVGPGVFPSTVAKSTLPYDTLVTVDTPELNYPDPVGYDMEAFAVWDTATRFVSGELVQFVKVVSDGPNSSIEEIDRARIIDLITNQIDAVVEISDSLRTLASQEALRLAPPQGLDEYLARWRFSVTLTHELTGQLRALAARDPAAPVMDEHTRSARSARDALDRLAARANAAPDGLGAS